MFPFPSLILVIAKWNDFKLMACNTISGALAAPVCCMRDDVLILNSLKIKFRLESQLFSLNQDFYLAQPAP